MKDADKKMRGLQESIEQPEQFGWFGMLVIHMPEWITVVVAILIIAFFDIPKDKTLAVFVIVAISIFVIFIYVVLYLMVKKVRKELRTSGRPRDHPE